MLDTKFINPFILGAVEALKVQGGLNMEGGKPFLKGHQTMPPISIAGQLGLTSVYFKGAVNICFEEKVYLKLMSNMLGEEFTSITPEIQDGAAEVLNIIYGTAKSQLNPIGYTFERAIPTVAFGTAIQTSHGRSMPVIVIPLRSEFGYCFIEIAVESL